MIRRIAVAATAGALALGGLAAFGVGTASAAVVITAGSGSNITCTTIKAKAALAPALKDNWVKADHSGDSNTAFAAIPDTTFASNGPVTVTSTTKASTCSGTVTDGTNTATVKKATLVLKSNPADPGSGNPATCEALVNPAPPVGTPGDPGGDASYIVDVTWASGTKGFSIAPTHAVGIGLQNSGAGFAVGGGTITGSFAGGSSTTQANVDAKTTTAFLSASFYTNLLAPVTSANAGTKRACQATAKQKKGVWSLKAPKGIKKIGIANGSVHFQR
jgi:hypothetical protein